ncbi:hypothetical protein D3C83_46370 [compost metagenome]
MCTASVMLREMWMLEPTLRTMWNTAEPWAMRSGARVAKLTMVIGTHSTPTPKPCSAIGQNTSAMLGLTSSCASCQPA